MIEPPISALVSYLPFNLVCSYTTCFISNFAAIIENGSFYVRTSAKLTGKSNFNSQS